MDIPVYKFMMYFSSFGNWFTVTIFFHVVELKIDSDDDDEDLPSISGGGLTDRYSFVQLHFHWGEGLLGSEHSINEQK